MIPTGMNRFKNRVVGSPDVCTHSLSELSSRAHPAQENAPMSHALELFRLDGKVAVVTGGTRGLGYFMAEGLAEAGADVAICGRGEHADLGAAVAKLSATGRDCIGVQCDVSEEEQVAEMAATLQSRYGRCDILVNNAGIGIIQPTLDYAASSFARMMDVNLKGAFLCSRALGQQMIEGGRGGCILNMSSINGQVGIPLGMSAYATSKIGVIGMSRALAAEWGPHGIRVNAILPGHMAEGMMEWVRSDSPKAQAEADLILKRIPLGNFGSGDDMKGIAVFLASDAGRYVTGEQILVDGGFVINGGN